MSKAKADERLQNLIDTQSAITQADQNLGQFMQIVASTVQELTGASGAVVELVEGDVMVYRCATGVVAPHVGVRLERNGSLSGLCVASAEVLRCNDVESDQRVDKEACRRIGVGSMICAPLFQMGQAVGVLKVVSGKSNGFSDEDVQSLTLLSGMLGASLGKQLALDALRKAESRIHVLLENARSFRNR
jgi:putative methionine-R-sulfoxide reductase with GAF domain